MKTEFNEAEAIRLTSIARPSVKNDPISMFASDEDLLIYEHFFINGMQHSKQVTMDSKTEPASEAKRIDFNDRINKGKTMPNAELITKCNDWIKSLAASGGKSWVLSIPVRYHVDPDMLFTELTTRFKDSLEEITRLKVELKSALLNANDVSLNSEAKERIEKEAARYQVVNNIYRVGGYHGYIAGATAEHNRAQEEITRLKAELERERELRKEAWNNAIDAVKDMLVVQMEDEENEGLAALEHVYSKLEPLKN